MHLRILSVILKRIRQVLLLYRGNNLLYYQIYSNIIFFRFSIFIKDNKFAMPPIKFHDAAGVPIQFLEVDGVLYPYPEGAQEESIRVKRDISGRDDDVLLAGYSKAGQYTCTKISQLKLR